ncbi:hypothetical protein ABIF33_008018 [Bradyrhizobium elkanii]|uniref:hypothetical protein n=1 Tax=Bradyrhizobium elkanii TaxID=29448 RepID=UPI003518EC52
MTHSYFELPKGPFFANDNFQELETGFVEAVGCEELGISRDSSTVGGPELQLRPKGHPSMVSGPAGAEHHAGGSSSSSGTHRYANWTTKTKIGRRKVTRCLSLAQVKDAQSAWHHARSIGQPMNRFVTFRPRGIDDQNPAQRIQTWTMWRNKLAQFARDHGFDFTCIWTRESERNTGLKEHMHVLMHVPYELQRRFKKVVTGWCEGTDEIDVKPCHYTTKTNHKGGASNVLTYVTKNSPQAGRFLQRVIQLGGPIFGNRYGLSRNLTARARARAAVAGGLRQDLRLPIITSNLNHPVPQPANDRGRKGGRSKAA